MNLSAKVTSRSGSCRSSSAAALSIVLESLKHYPRVKFDVLTISTNFLVFSLILVELLLTTCYISFVPNLLRAFGDSVLLTTATLSGD